jgi:hypothetical protein
MDAAPSGATDIAINAIARGSKAKRPLLVAHFLNCRFHEVTHGGCVGTLTFHVPVLTSEVSVVLWDGIRAQPGGISALKLRGVAPVDAAQQASRDLPRLSTAFGRSLVVDDFHPDLISRGLQ